MPSPEVRGILLDIEGTTTPVAFVYDILFPFARAHAGKHLDTNIQNALKTEHEVDVLKGLNPPAWDLGPLAYVHWLMDQERKSTALKELQGRIWEDGYRHGVLKGDVFPDVPEALIRWQHLGIDVRIFSSGSILAQRLLFSTTRYGNLTHLMKGYFDTTTGPKSDPESYLAIARAFALQPKEILFISDVVRELDAAATAGYLVLLSVRPGNTPQPPNVHPIVSAFTNV